MKTVGIIAEYNPFHTGHKYHIENTRQNTGADCIVIIMSGDFVQRGVPAIADKFTRAKSALLGGADLVLELPTVYSTGSAEIFAKGAISILNSLGGIDYLSFGGESDNLGLLNSIASILADEPQEYKELLQKELRSGLSMPLARKAALLALFPQSEIENIINTPNNILAIEYLKALKDSGSTITPVITKRTGSGYHDTELNTAFASATALRECFNIEDFCNLNKFMPDNVFELYRSIHCSSMPVFSDDMDMLLYHSILTAQNSLEEYLDVNGNLSNKLRNFLRTGEIPDYDTLIMSLKSKELTYTRISRALLHILLGIKTADFEALKAAAYPCYGRLLAFNETGRSFLNSIRKNTSLPLITNLSDKNIKLNELQKYLLDKDIYAANIYRNIVKTKFRTTLKDEFRCTPINLG